MKLLKQVIEKHLEKYDEARINKKFAPETYYSAITLASLAINKQIENAELLNELYASYNKAKLQGDKTKEKICISQFKKEMLKDAVFIDEFRKKFRNIKIEDDTHANFYHKKAVGFLALEDDG